MSDEREHRPPTTDQPLNAERRPTWTPLLAVVVLIVAILAVFALITWLRYHT